MRNIWKNRLIIQAAAANGITTRRKVAKVISSVVDQNTLQFFEKARAKNLPISGPLLKAAARKFASQEINVSLVFSEGWLSSFRKRNNLSFNVEHGEARSADPESGRIWQESLPEILHAYPLEDIFNADETGLFYKRLPKKTLMVKGIRAVD